MAIDGRAGEVACAGSYSVAGFCTQKTLPGIFLARTIKDWRNSKFDTKSCSLCDYVYIFSPQGVSLVYKNNPRESSKQCKHVGLVGCLLLHYSSVPLPNRVMWRRASDEVQSPLGMGPGRRGCTCPARHGRACCCCRTSVVAAVQIILVLVVNI